MSVLRLSFGSVILAFQVLVTTSSAGAQDALPAGTKLTVQVAAGDKLKMREWANASSSIVVELPPAAGIVATGRSHKNETDAWIEVVYQAKKGWVNSRFVVLVRSEGSPRIGPNAPYGRGDVLRVEGATKGDKLNMRADPSAQSTIVFELPAQATGMVATGESRRNGDVTWIGVKYQNKIGWVNARFVKPTGRGAESPETTAAIIPPAPQLADPISACDSPDPRRRLEGCTAALARDELLPAVRAIAYSRRADSHLHNRHYDLAIADLTEATKLDAKDEPYRQRLAAAYYLRGLTASKERKFDSAIADYTKAIEVDAHFEAAFDARVRTYVDKGDIDKAIEDLANAVRFDRTDQAKGRGLAELCKRRAAERLARGDYPGAIDDYTQAIDVTGDDTMLLLARANLYLIKEDYRAEQDASKVISMEPGNVQAYMIRGQMRAFRRDYNSAIDDFSVVLKTEKKPVTALLARALAYEQLHKFDEALSDYRSVLKFEPKNVTARKSPGRLTSLKKAITH